MVGGREFTSNFPSCSADLDDTTDGSKGTGSSRMLGKGRRGVIKQDVPLRLAVS